MTSNNKLEICEVCVKQLLTLKTTIMNFSNKKVLRTFSSPHSKNVYGNIETLGWKKVAQNSTDGVTNMAIILNAACANNRTVTGTIDASNQISILYMP